MIGVLVFGWLAAGCGTPGGEASRELGHGPVRVGDTPETVIGVIGRPDHQTDGPDATGYTSVWTYQNYFATSAGPQATGWTQVLSPETRDQHGRVVHQAVVKDIDRAQLGGTLRVTFAHGVVSSVARVGT